MQNSERLGNNSGSQTYRWVNITNPLERTQRTQRTQRRTRQRSNE
jgi:hypothetical protein